MSSRRRAPGRPCEAGRRRAARARSDAVTTAARLLWSGLRVACASRAWGVQARLRVREIADGSRTRPSCSDSRIVAGALGGFRAPTEAERRARDADEGKRDRLIHAAAARGAGAPQRRLSVEAAVAPGRTGARIRRLLRIEAAPVRGRSSFASAADRASATAVAELRPSPVPYTIDRAPASGSPAGLRTMSAWSQPGRDDGDAALVRSRAESPQAWSCSRRSVKSSRSCGTVTSTLRGRASSSTCRCPCGGRRAVRGRTGRRATGALPVRAGGRPARRRRRPVRHLARSGSSPARSGRGGGDRCRRSGRPAFQVTAAAGQRLPVQARTPRGLRTRRAAGPRRSRRRHALIRPARSRRLRVERLTPRRSAAALRSPSHSCMARCDRLVLGQGGGATRDLGQGPREVHDVAERRPAASGLAQAQVLGPDLAAVAQDGAALQAVLQLAHVAGPGVLAGGRCAPPR